MAPTSGSPARSRRWERTTGRFSPKSAATARPRSMPSSKPAYCGGPARRRHRAEPGPEPTPKEVPIDIVIGCKACDPAPAVGCTERGEWPGSGPGAGRAVTMAASSEQGGKPLSEDALRSSVRQLIADVDARDRVAFRGAQYDRGLAWVQFPAGQGRPRPEARSPDGRQRRVATSAARL